MAIQEGVLSSRLGFPAGRSAEVSPHRGGLPRRPNPGEPGPGDGAREVPGRRVRASPPVSHEVREPLSPLSLGDGDLFNLFLHNLEK